MSSPVAHWQIVAPDPGRLADFYRKLFGWSISSSNALGYREVRAERSGIPGGFWPAPADAKPIVQLFVAVADVDSAVTRAGALGAKVLVPVTALPDGDVMAILVDPAGVAFGLMQARQEGAAQTATQIVVQHLPGPAWKPGVGPREQVGIDAHVAHYRQLLDDGRLARGGPFLDKQGGGMMLVRAGEDPSVIEQFAAADPAVQSGLLRFAIRQWAPVMDGERA